MPSTLTPPAPAPASVRRRGAPRIVRLLSVPVVAALVLGGGWVAAGRVTNDFKLSVLLTAAWVSVVGLACLALVVRRREMWPALLAFALTAGAGGAYLAAQTLIDQRVDEDVVTAAPTSARSPAGTAGRETSANVLLARGRFESLAHGTDGVAQVIELRRRRRFLTLTRFETAAGPDLRVYLSTDDADVGSAGEDFEDLGGLKGNIGDQQYEIPVDVDLGRLTRVLIWCRAFSVGFGSAPLRPT